MLTVTFGSKPYRSIEGKDFIHKSKLVTMYRSRKVYTFLASITFKSREMASSVVERTSQIISTGYIKALLRAILTNLLLSDLWEKVAQSTSEIGRAHV